MLFQLSRDHQVVCEHRGFFLGIPRTQISILHRVARERASRRGLCCEFEDLLATDLGDLLSQSSSLYPSRSSSWSVLFICRVFSCSWLRWIIGGFRGEESVCDCGLKIDIYIYIHVLSIVVYGIVLSVWGRALCWTRCWTRCVLLLFCVDVSVSVGQSTEVTVLHLCCVCRLSAAVRYYIYTCIILLVSSAIADSRPNNFR